MKGKNKERRVYKHNKEESRVYTSIPKEERKVCSHT